MFATTAHAQTPGGAPAGGGGQDLLLQFAPLLLVFVIGYFMLFRPAQQRQKQQRETLAKIKRGDTVVMTSGIIGKVSRVDDTELGVEIAPTVVVKVVRSMISEVRAKGEPAPANDAKG